MKLPSFSVMEKQQFITVTELYEAKAHDMGIHLAGGLNGLQNQITSARLQKLGLALGGYTNYLLAGRVQFLGRTEANFLSQMNSDERQKAIEGVFCVELSCIFVTGGVKAPEDLLEYAKRHKVPVLITDIASTRVTDEISEFLEEKLAPSTTVHAVLMEVFGMGVLIVGESGIGKSECGLDLVLRGHRLVSDDIVVIRRLGSGRLIGSGPDYLSFYMELRGLGIINIRDLFGISSVSPTKEIDLAIELIRWQDRTEVDRLALPVLQYELLDTAIPLIRMPVASGRNVATLVEVAVRIHMLRKQGYEPTTEFISRHQRQLKSTSEVDT